MAADATVKVTTETRDRLAELAAERGTSIGGLLDEFTQQHPSQAQIDAERRRTRAWLRDYCGYEPGDAERDELRRRLADQFAAVEQREADILARTMRTAG